MSPQLDILIVEDEPGQREMLAGFLEGQRHRVSMAECGRAALELVTRKTFDLMVLDYRMPDMNGIAVLEQARQIDPQIDVVMVTAYGTIENAVEAMKAGASEYLTKPIDLEELTLLIERIAAHRSILRENDMLRQHIETLIPHIDTIRYQSPVMAELIQSAAKIAQSPSTVLITGETGTGKELLARLIHGLSSRRNRPFVAINCAAIPEGLIESELFGHEKGAFTGAVQRKIGRIEQAEGGTLFLDEIGEMTPGVQVKLLRFLQEREICRVGGERTIRVDVRIICATHADLMKRVEKGLFRQDLLYRIQVLPLDIPPLRQRREDIPVLVDHFVERFAAKNRKPIPSVTREASRLLYQYDYPGNVRELENIIERAVVICDGAHITAADLPFQQTSRSGHPDTSGDLPALPLQDALLALERHMIEQAMTRADNNQSRAAALLGLSERMLRYKLKKSGLRKA
ncbi:sigma-54-dependent transcriptional regulator [Desulfatirhabdium butyrativorans]|uniref:sigma-54-dependent transcriptional regulator n=1 Tax=Desulfatirhabdium butyrativorans TaxID=340467 RepID=UPI0003FE6E31|nr:sigma-54 dependent transcriptional regulator [Desulfatirhabdium butyrativorans]